MSFQNITDNITNPGVAIATVGTGATWNLFIAALPIFINVGMAIYVVFLIYHKWQQIQEMKKKKREKEDEPS